MKNRTLFSIIVTIFVLLCLTACGDDTCVHDFQQTSTTNASCTAEGLTRYSCTLCGEEKTEVIPQLRHNYSSTITAASTCVKEGEKVFTCSGCADTYTESIPTTKHDYSSTITTAPTCTAEGIKTFTCSGCADTYTESIPTTEHDYSSTVTTAPTCTSEGVEALTCKNCNDSCTQVMKPIAHSYTDTITTQPTCTATGEKTYTCTACGNTYTAPVPALGHEPNKDMFCTRCGEKCPINLDMTSSEQMKASAVYYISNRQVWHQDDEGRYVLVFSLLDKSKAHLYAPAVAEVRITNLEGEVVYSATKILKSSDFMTWYYNNGDSRLQGTVFIYDHEITAGLSDAGNISLTVYNEGYFSFTEHSMEINGLPSTVTWYGEGTYLVGRDIPAGEYFIRASYSDYFCYFAIKDSSNKILDNDNFHNCAYVNLQDGQKFEVNRGRFALASSIQLTLDLNNIPEGMYRVGIDIPTGEYFIRATNNDSMCYFAILDKTGDILENENFYNWHFVTVEASQYIQINRGTMVTISSAKLDVDLNSFPQAMYRVGIDIPAGEYQLTPTSSDSFGYYAIYDNSSADRDIRSNDNFKSAVTITVHNGEYLLTNRCTGQLIRQIEEPPAGGGGGDDDTLWSFSEAKKLNELSNNAFDAINTALNHCIQAGSTKLVSYKVMYLKYAVQYAEQAEGYLDQMKLLADSNAALELTDSEFDSLQELIAYTKELCQTISSLSITTDNYAQQSELLTDTLPSILTYCLRISKLSVELLKAFT